MSDEMAVQNLEMRKAQAMRIAQNVIKKFEPLRQHAEVNAQGEILLGFLRRVDAKGISKQEADYLLMNDLRDVLADLMPMTLYLLDLSEVRIAVLFHMAFLLGTEQLKNMKGLWSALRARDYETAVDEMLLSDWPTRVGQSDAERRRAIELLRMMRTGQVRHTETHA